MLPNNNDPSKRFNSLNDKKESNPFLKDLSSEESGELLKGLRSKDDLGNVGSSDVRIDFDEQITTHSKPIKGAFASPEDLKEILEKRKKQDEKKKPRGAFYDDIKPGNKDNEPDPDHYQGDDKMNEF